MIARLSRVMWQLVLGCLLVAGCSKVSDQNPVEKAGNVNIYGTLQRMMHDNRTAAVVQLDQLLPSDQLFGLGALSELRGEITILGGQTVLSYSAGDDSIHAVLVTESEEGAALLVTAKVVTWKPTTTPGEIIFEKLDERIAELAARAGVDTDLPFPFMVLGRVTGLKYHVVDGERLAKGSHSREEHLAAAIKRSLPNTTITLLGFYSEHHQGIFTHQGSKTHIHCFRDDPPVSGHVDDVTLPAGTIIMFPVFAESPPAD
ncbi:MAG: acetolactate decarboxylase [Candidatus Marinimicrobia bacterium]|nr:acetolactate decarboxylase [Candidatus Neomarinimicrobiota bacterium]